MNGVPGSSRLSCSIRMGLLALALGIPPCGVIAGDVRNAVIVRRRPVVAVPTARVVTRSPQHLAPLGTFGPTPYIWVRGNAPAGGGYSPLGAFGDATMVLYGPTSSLRATSAPVLTYTRGYDGRTIVAPGTSFSTPNLPALSPVVYPTQANDYFGFRTSGEPPWWQNAMDWLDQN